MKHVFHPGLKVAKVIKKLGVTQEVFAERLGIDRPTLNMIVNEKRNVTANMAIKLEKVTGISARKWVIWQAEYDLSEARKEHRDS